MYIIIKKDKEIFRIITYPFIKKNSYLISNFGKVKDIHINKIINPYSDKKGYLYSVLIGETKKVKIVGTHRLVAWEFVNGYNKEQKRTNVNHKDTCTFNNYYENLEWVTTKENNEFSLIHSKSRFGCKGSLNYYAKYSEEIVEDICKYLEKGLTQMQIMHIYGYKKRKDNNSFYSLIDGIKYGKWDHISKNYKIENKNKVQRLS